MTKIKCVKSMTKAERNRLIKKLKKFEQKRDVLKGEVSGLRQAMKIIGTKC